MYFLQDSFGQKIWHIKSAGVEKLEGISCGSLWRRSKYSFAIICSSLSKVHQENRTTTKSKARLEQREKDVRNDIKKLGEDNQLLVSTAENIQITPTRKLAASQGLISSSKNRRKSSFEVCTPVRQTLNVMTASENSPAVAESDVYSG